MNHGAALWIVCSNNRDSALKKKCTSFCKNSNEKKEQNAALRSIIAVFEGIQAYIARPL
jgi:hypothetical protein